MLCALNPVVADAVKIVGDAVVANYGTLGTAAAWDLRTGDLLRRNRRTKIWGQAPLV
jgi:hypothetical protein